MITETNILYQDEYFIAINKPHNLLVHRTKIAAEDDVFALQLVRDLTGKHVYTVHRIDRGTGGILLFAFNPETQKKLQKLFENKTIHKSYLAICRGFSPKNTVIDKPLKKGNSQNLQEAETLLKTVSTTEINVQVSNYPTSRYSLVNLIPKTGRTHQIRRHLNHISCPIICDYQHGDYRHNQYFREELSLQHLLLHAHGIKFPHPNTGEKINIIAPLHQTFQNIINYLGFNNDYQTFLNNGE